MSTETKNKDIVISIKNLPPAAFDTMCDYIQLMSAELMRTMANIRHLLAEDSSIATTYQKSQQTENQNK